MYFVPRWDPFRISAGCSYLLVIVQDAFQDFLQVADLKREIVRRPSEQGLRDED